MDDKEIRQLKLAGILGFYSDQNVSVLRRTDLQAILELADLLPDIDVSCEVHEFPKAVDHSSSSSDL